MSVLVVGAGMAGLSAAHRLKMEYEIDPIVLEARPRHGGRIFTVSRNDRPLDMGAQWIHGGCEENAAFSFAKSRGLLGDPIQYLVGGDLSPGDFPGDFHVEGGARITGPVLQDTQQVYGRIMDSIQYYYKSRGPEGQLQRETVEQAFQAKVESWLAGQSQHKSAEYCENFRRIMQCYKTTFAFYLGDSLSRLRKELSGTSVEHPGGDVVVPGGMSSLTAALVGDIGRENINFEHVVTRIEWRRDKVYVTALVRGMTERVFEVDHVICSLPLGVLQYSMVAMFHPPLPARKVAAISRMNAGSVGKLYFRFDQPMSREGHEEDCGLHFAWEVPPFPTTDANLDPDGDWVRGIEGYTGVKGHADLVLVWVDGIRNKIAETLPDDQLVEDFNAVLCKFSPVPSAAPRAVEVIRHLWVTDEFTRGTFSHPGVEMQLEDIYELSEPLMIERIPKVLFCGEATEKNNWSNVHGARMSGIRETERLGLLWLEQRESWMDEGEQS